MRGTHQHLIAGLRQRRVSLLSFRFFSSHLHSISCLFRETSVETLPIKATICSTTSPYSAADLLSIYCQKYKPKLIFYVIRAYLYMITPYLQQDGPGFDAWTGRGAFLCFNVLSSV